MTNQQILERAITKAIDVYDIQTNGYIERRDNGRPIFGSINHKGYRYISVYLPDIKKSKKIAVHRLVALRYIPNPYNLPHINHIDGNRLNNQVDNLEWCTASYNVSDGFKRGRVIWNKGNVSKERVMFYARKYPRQLFWLLTKDDFMIAKAIWGEEKREWLGRFIWHSKYEPESETFKDANDLLNSWVYAGEKKPTVAELDSLPPEGIEACAGIVEKLTEITNKGFQYHLQQLVIAPDPIKYLGENLGE